MGPILLVISAITASVSSTVLTLKFTRIMDGNTLRISEAGGINQSAHKPFDWSTYFDPKTPEFWDDGDGQPPRPFRHVASFPTNENIANLKKWIKLQEEKIADVNKMIEKDEIKSLDPTIQDVKQELLSQAKGHKKRRSDELSQIDMVYIYSTTCSACAQARPVVERLKTEGVEVTMLQTDFEGGIEPGSLPYSKEYQDAFPVSVTPTFYIKVGPYTATKIEGFKLYAEIVASLSQHINSEIKKKS